MQFLHTMIRVSNLEQYSVEELENTKELKNYSPPKTKNNIKEKSDEIPRVFEDDLKIKKNQL